MDPALLTRAPIRRIRTTQRRTFAGAALAVLWLGLASYAAMADDAAPTLDELDELGARIGAVRIVVVDVFDTAIESENTTLKRLANRLHIETRKSTIRSQLLFHPGETFDSHKILESERVLRNNAYLFDAKITIDRYVNGIVDLTVTTRDNWTLSPELSFSRNGGENESIFGVEDTNLFGTGTRISITRENDIDRDSTVFEFSDRNLGRSWVGLDLAYAEADDGNTKTIAVNRPFYALDTHWSAGTTIFSDDRVDTLYSNGDQAARYRRDQRFFTASYGRSAGLIDGWVRRWTAGIVIDDNDFSSRTSDGLIARAPADRKLVYPYLQLQVVEDRYVTATNFNNMARTEDVYLGTTYSARVGWFAESFGADRDGLIFDAAYATSAGSPQATMWQLHGSVRGRLESGDVRNTIVSATTQYRRRQSARRTMYAKLSLVSGHKLDLDNTVVLGGDSGLRGYPFRYRNGHSSALLRIEQRYYTDYYPFRLFHVGGAVFFDAGRSWGRDVTGRKQQDLLADVGFGLRLGSARIGSNKVFHLDVAFPLNRDSTIDGVQLSIDGRRSF